VLTCLNPASSHASCKNGTPVCKHQGATDQRKPASILRLAHGFHEHISLQFEVVLCGVAQMNAIQASIGSLREGLHTWGQRVKMAQEDEKQDAQELQQACASHSQAVTHVCKLQVNFLTSGVTVWQYAHVIKDMHVYIDGT